MPMNNVDLALGNEPGRATTSSKAEPEIRRVPVEHGGPPATGKRKGPVWNGSYGEPRVTEPVCFHCVCRPTCRTGDECHRNTALEQLTHEIVDMALEPTHTVKRSARTRDHRHTEPIVGHRRSLSSVR